ncbi:ankyrin repeat domain-containing protein [Flavobacterium nitratireducens]|uniref:ankyrin repeat domain-containing protein n=1 Tax=Flavobacterium nitratireducens TaxID=992289 RepID=UPI0024151C8C|nr:ankyrin repeat domain-containing protein [Flavobacterium nitratireducens]
MKKNLFVSIALTVISLVNAQQKNSLLEQSFWKSAPDVTAIKAEIAKGNNPSESTSNAFDAVVIAINNDAPAETIKFLIEQPGNGVKKMTHDNRIYLHWASNKGNVEIINYLIAKGSDLNLEDSKGYTPLTFAVSSGQKNTTVYDAFFKAGMDPKKKDKEGVNLLLIAIPYDKDLTLTNYFISKGLSLKDTDNKGLTAFDYAARTGNIEVLKTLLQKGVIPTNNALLIAAQGSRREANTLELYKYLAEDLKLNPSVISTDGETVLHNIVRKANQNEIIDYFLSKGVDINKTDNDGNTALMNAASSRESDALELLVSKVKDINLKNTKGESALSLAVQNGTPKAVELLLSQKADINVVDKDGNNLGYYLIQSYRPQMLGGGRGPEASTTPKEDPFATKLKLLQDNGLHLAEAQKDGSSLYHFAVLKNDITLLKKLADLNIDINAKNKNGLTALHKAAMIAKNDAILKYLLSIGAKKDIKTDFDETAYDLAKENETLTKNNIAVEILK